MNYEKEKVCGWHDAHIGLYASAIKGLKETEKVGLQSFSHKSRCIWFGIKQ